MNLRILLVTLRRYHCALNENIGSLAQPPHHIFESQHLGQLQSILWHCLTYQQLALQFQQGKNLQRYLGLNLIFRQPIDLLSPNLVVE